MGHGPCINGESSVFDSGNRSRRSNSNANGRIITKVVFGQSERDSRYGNMVRGTRGLF